MAPLPLITDRLEIRSLRADDADGLHRVFGDPEAMRYVGPNGRARTRAQTAENVARFMAAEREQGFGLWAAERREDGRMIGLCGLTLVEGTGPDVEVVYVLERPAWGLGYATEMTAGLPRRRVRPLRARPHHRPRLPAEHGVDPGDAEVRHARRGHAPRPRERPRLLRGVPASRNVEA